VGVSVICVLVFTVFFTVCTVFFVLFRLCSRTRMELQFNPGPARKLSTNLYDI
jgi:hypothetical protein